ncbi:family 3 adenylate cyclase [Bernardetia litoralis DSM 6794]|uniref:Adenylate cyclase n=1 Tax=Bernardetia litoralis (strain ATCC 23117 / DSM 6794 / NBRC 15988 / NCIMB 1366 / Fx l1 / Sio-4) TaxID=880071 RepID=I4AF82_BERLS|nr:adenylate/guanylate cyclase domain-containing protein [Bernardetia litoralis]AFM02617.1 family 3 adenylate cyclase [Bernardetia litoralis DSM 6794]
MKKNYVVLIIAFVVLLFIPFDWSKAQNYNRRQVISKIRNYDAKRKRALKNGDHKTAISLSWQIAESYHLIKQTGLMVRYYERAIYAAEKQNDKLLEARSHEKLGDKYEIPDFFTKKNKQYKEAAELYNEINEFEKQGNVLRKIVKITHKERDYENLISTAETLLSKKDTFQITRQDRINLSTVLMEAHTKQGSEEKIKLFELMWEQAQTEKPDPRDKKRELAETMKIDPMLLSQRELEFLRTQKRELTLDIDSQKYVIERQGLELQLQTLDLKIKESDRQRQEANAKKQKAEAETQRAEAKAQRATNNQYLIGLIGGGIVLILSVVAFVQKFNSNRKLSSKNKEIELERQKSDTLLLNILPEETAQELKETGHAQPHSYELVTVLFTDFKGFTQISEKLSPEELVKKLEYCFTEFDKICDANNLEKIKTIGDAYMCAGGVPVANASNPKDAVNAGLEMQKFMAKWKTTQEKLGEPTFELRLGIHTGSVVAGVIGKNKFAYDIWGDTVNLAARMESSGQIGKVNISETTYKHVKNDFECEHRGKIIAKNKGEIDMYFVESVIN